MPPLQGISLAAARFKRRLEPETGMKPAIIKLAFQIGGFNLTIMIGVAIPNLALDNLPVNWFDGVVVGILIIGLFLGRKHGMSKEILPLLKWVSLVLVCGIWYPMAAQFLVNSAELSRVSSCIFGYLLLAFAIFLVFSIQVAVTVKMLGTRIVDKPSVEQLRFTAPFAQ